MTQMHPNSDIVALACKEAIPAPWTGAPWPTGRRLGGPTWAADPSKTVPQFHSPVSPAKEMPHGRGMGDEGGACREGLDVDGTRKIMVKMTTS